MLYGTLAQLLIKEGIPARFEWEVKDELQAGVNGLHSWRRTKMDRNVRSEIRIEAGPGVKKLNAQWVVAHEIGHALDHQEGWYVRAKLRSALRFLAVTLGSNVYFTLWAIDWGVPSFEAVMFSVLMALAVAVVFAIVDDIWLFAVMEMRADRYANARMNAVTLKQNYLRRGVEGWWENFACDRSEQNE